MHTAKKSLLLALHIFFLIFMGHRIGIWLVCQLLYCLWSCGCICIYNMYIVACCVCECVTVWVIVWVSAFVLFLSWKRAIIAQPNITDLILDRTTEWPQSNGEWQLDFSNKLVYFAIASRRNIIPKFMRHASSAGGGYDFKFSRIDFGIRIRHSASRSTSTSTSMSINFVVAPENLISSCSFSFSSRFSAWFCS